MTSFKSNFAYNNDFSSFFSSFLSLLFLEVKTHTRNFFVKKKLTLFGERRDYYARVCFLFYLPNNDVLIPHKHLLNPFSESCSNIDFLFYSCRTAYGI